MSDQARRPSSALLVIGAIGFGLLVIAAIILLQLLQALSFGTAIYEPDVPTISLFFIYAIAPIMAGIGLLAAKRVTNIHATMAGWLFILFPLAVLVLALAIPDSPSDAEALMMIAIPAALIALGWLFTGTWALKAALIRRTLAKITGISSLITGLGALVLVALTLSAVISENQGSMTEGRFMAQIQALQIAAWMGLISNLIAGTGLIVVFSRDLFRS